MQLKYAVYNAQTGQNTLFDSKEEAVQEFWKYVVALAKTHFNSTAYTVVEQYPDGTEKWYNDNNQEIDNPLSYQEINNIISNSTPVEVLP